MQKSRMKIEAKLRYALDAHHAGASLPPKKIELRRLFAMAMCCCELCSCRRNL